MHAADTRLKSELRILPVRVCGLARVRVAALAWVAHARPDRAGARPGLRLRLQLRSEPRRLRPCCVRKGASAPLPRAPSRSSTPKPPAWPPCRPSRYRLERNRHGRSPSRRRLTAPAWRRTLRQRPENGAWISYPSIRSRCLITARSFPARATGTGRILPGQRSGFRDPDAACDPGVRISGGGR